MMGMAMTKGINDAVGILLTFPLFVAGIAAASMATSRRSGAYNFLTFLVIRKALGWLVAFFGNLLRLAYSRQREYKADAVAAELVGSEHMIAALVRLGGDMTVIPDEQAQYAMFKVAGRGMLPALFRTHPSLEDRIAALGGPRVEPARPEGDSLAQSTGYNLGFWWTDDKPGKKKEDSLADKLPKRIWS